LVEHLTTVPEIEDLNPDLADKKPEKLFTFSSQQYSNS